MPESEDFAVSFFEEILADPAIKVFIAEEDEKAIGYIVCKLVERPETPFTFLVRFLLVDQISVRPEAQGKRAGRALIQETELLARELDVSRIQLDFMTISTLVPMYFLNGWDFRNLVSAFGSTFKEKSP